MFFIKSLNRAIVTLLSFFIKGHQIVISPILGKSCRFHPSCSNYALVALKEKGAWRGSLMIVKRILKCNPFHPGGYDPIK